MTLPPSLRQRVLDAAARSPSPPRGPSLRRRAVVQSAGAAFAAIVFFALGGYQLGARPAAFISLSALGWGALALVVTTLGVGRGASMTGRPTRTLVTLAIVTMPALIAWVVAVRLGWPGLAAPVPGPGANIRCLLSTLALALGPFAAFVATRRGSDPVHPRALGAVVGAASGAWGAVLIDLHCTVNDLGHISLSHALPALALAALGALVGERLLGLAHVPV